MYLFFIDCFLLALGCGIVAVVYRHILAYEPVLQWWFRFGNRYEKAWFFPAVWGCHKCISGQLGLWFFIFLEIIPGVWQTDMGFWEFFGIIFGLLLTICGAIFTAVLLAPVITKIENR